MNTIVFPESVVGKESAGAYVRADEARDRITELETRLAIKADAHAASMLVIAELEKQLSLYQGGVEVEGYVWTREVYKGSDTREAYFEVQMPMDYAGQRVRVLVIPEERIVDANKTMEVE